MGRYWKINCPHCNAEIASGSGYGDAFPQIYVPFLRCMICGQLYLTKKKEYLTMSVEERTKLRPSETNCKLINESLDRTCNMQYVSILQQNGFEIYPITEQDGSRFTKVNFDQYKDGNSSENATQSLYNAGILIKAEERDDETGGVKKEILEENRKQYQRQRKIKKYSSIVGLIVGILFASFFGDMSPHGYLCLLGVPFGFGGAIITIICFTKYYDIKDKSNQSKNDGNALQTTEVQSETPREQHLQAQDKEDTEYRPLQK